VVDPRKFQANSLRENTRAYEQEGWEKSNISALERSHKGCTKVPGVTRSYIQEEGTGHGIQKKRVKGVAGKGSEKKVYAKDHGERPVTLPLEENWGRRTLPKCTKEGRSYILWTGNGKPHLAVEEA